MTEDEFDAARNKIQHAVHRAWMTGCQKDIGEMQIAAALVGLEMCNAPRNLVGAPPLFALISIPRPDGITEDDSFFYLYPAGTYGS